MIKRVTLWEPRQGVSTDEALAHWRGVHARLVEQLPGVRRYVQRPCMAGPDGKPSSCAGVGELWFDDLDAAKAALTTPEWDAVLADASTFMDLERVRAAWVEDDAIL